MLAAATYSFAISLLLIWAMMRFAHRLPLDVPNERSLHERPVPRTGGVGVLGGVCLCVAGGIVPFGPSLGIALGLAAVSFLDDIHGLATGARLAAHLLAAGALVWYVLSPMDLWALALIGVAVAWITNLYNFMDGSDGLAGGMSVIGFSVYATASSMAGDPATAALSIALAGASAAFLLFNFHPARIFLGDVGSIPIGFLAAALGIVGWRNDAWPLWFPVLVFGPFIADATMTLLRRALRGERLWRAHREHYYQRMVRMGLGHRGTAFVAYGAMIICAAAALLGRDKGPGMQAAVLAGASGFLGALALWVDLKWSRYCRRMEAGA